MNKPKLLPGEELVAKGEAKASVSLPEIGLKDVIPNGSWLERKQVQSALEARKHLIEAERIEKCGILSQAEWKEELKLAKVTKQCGSYWQFMGHHKDYQLYLRPEEALFLIEVNSLLLKYNGITVSLQQAYSLLLRDNIISIMQYKVYASLSRLGYKVFRHVKPTVSDKTKENKEQGEKNDTESIIANTQEKKEETDNNNKKDEVLENCTDSDVSQAVKSVDSENNIENSEENNEMATNKVQDTAVNSTIDIDLTLSDKCVDGVKDASMENEADSAKEIIKIENDVTVLECLQNDNKDAENVCIKHSNDTIIRPDGLDTTPNPTVIPSRKYRLARTKSFKNKISKKNKTKDIQKYFKNVPKMLHKNVVTIKVPSEYIPDHIYPNRIEYEINLKAIKTRRRTPSSNSNEYSVTDESNDAHRIEDTPSFRVHPNQTHSNTRQFRNNFQFNQFHFWRPRYANNFFPFNLFFARPFYRNAYFQPRFQFHPRNNYFRPFSNVPLFNSGEANNVMSDSSNPANNFASTSQMTNSFVNSPMCSESQQSDRDNKEQRDRWICIKKLALKVRRHRGDNRRSLVSFLEALIKTYNSRYSTKIQLTTDYEVVDVDPIETIILDDNDEVESKRPRLDDSSHFSEAYSKIKKLAQELQELAVKGLATPRHRRALSSVVRTFNQSFNADVYINNNFEIIDRRFITLDSSSDSDCVINENTGKRKKLPVGKKLRNPFNVLKRLSQTHSAVPSCSKQDSVENVTDEMESTCNARYSEVIRKAFRSHWLPKETDFGRAEVPPRSLMLSRIIDSNKQEFIYDFIKNHNCKFDDWADIKASFLENIEAAAAVFQSENNTESAPDLDSIIKPDDCTDMKAVLKKLSIISNYNEVNHDVSLTIDFDVYNRDVKTFRKCHRPKPHFRIICINESASNLLSGADVAALHASCDDEVPLLFAIINASSISYLQINPMETPTYIPGTDV